MNVLQVCKKMPVPTKDGEALAILNMTTLLIEQQVQVTLLAIATQKHPGNLADLPKDIKNHIHFNQCNVNTNFNGLTFLKSVIQGDAYTLNRFYSIDYEKLIQQTLQQQQFDIVQLEGLYLLPYVELIRKFSTAKIVLRAHNVEHHVWQNLSTNSSNYLKKKIYQFNANSLKSIEEKSLESIDAVVSISTEDQTFFKRQHHIPCLNIPFGVQLDDYQIHPSLSESVSISFIGSLDWLPNIEGLQWFIEKVWTSIHQQFPKIKFHIAGRNMPASFKKTHAPNVIIEGEVPCAKQFIAAHPIFVVPLLSGSGMRIKIIEAMALQAAVVSTPLGASGIQYTNQSNILIAQNPAEFSKSIGSLIKNTSLRSQIAKNGRQLVEKQYNNLQLSKSLVNFYRTLLH